MTQSTPLPDAAGLLSTPAMMATGWTRSTLDTALDRGHYLRERRGVVSVRQDRADEFGDLAPTQAGLAARDREQQVLRTAASAARLSARAVLSHAPAAVIDEVPLVFHAVRPCLTVPSGTAMRNLARLHLHRAAIPRWQVRTWDRYTMTTTARTCLDLAREFGIDAGVVAMDSALHRQLTSPAELDAVLASCTRWPGKRLARAAFELADDRSESPLETLSRLGFLRDGLSDLIPQAVILDEYGRFVARLDFLWPTLGVVGEADGLGKYGAGFETMIKQRAREAAVARLGLEFVRWGWPELSTFDVVLREVSAAASRVREAGRPQLWRLGKADAA